MKIKEAVLKISGNYANEKEDGIFLASLSSDTILIRRINNVWSSSLIGNSAKVQKFNRIIFNLGGR